MLLIDFLTVLQVPHTEEFTQKQFDSMSFKSLFGLSKLLESYGIESEGLYLSDRKEIRKLTPPFIVHTPEGFVVVTNIGEDCVEYLTQGVREHMPLQKFRRAWDGNVFLAFPKPDAAEPGYAAHARMIFFTKAKRWLFWIAGILLFAYLFIANGIYRYPTMILACVCDMIGLTMSYLLVQKSMNIKSRAADKVCGVLQEGGCDKVLETKASTFFGIFSWSEVGFTYFSVSLLVLLMFPQWIGYLAACNVCCLPFTVWSLWYQKFRAKHWCTLCVSVQATLWLLFACYISGGWLKDIFPLRIEFFVLIVTYGFVLLGLNRIVPMMTKKADDPKSTTQNISSAG